MKQSSVENILNNYAEAGRESLIPILQEVQEIDGYLSELAVQKIGEHLKLPASKIYGVATFYNQFRFKPRGKFHIQVCRGTACHVKNSARVLDAVQRELKIKAGETSRDGVFSLEVVACIGACGLAPVICINGEFYAGVTPEQIKKILKDCRSEECEDGSNGR